MRDYFETQTLYPWSIMFSASVECLCKRLFLSPVYFPSAIYKHAPLVKVTLLSDDPPQAIRCSLCVGLFCLIFLFSLIRRTLINVGYIFTYITAVELNC